MNPEREEGRKGHGCRICRKGRKKEGAGRQK